MFKGLRVHARYDDKALKNQILLTYFGIFSLLKIKICIGLRRILGKSFWSSHDKDSPSSGIAHARMSNIKIVSLKCIGKNLKKSIKSNYPWIFAKFSDLK